MWTNIFPVDYLFCSQFIFINICFHTLKNLIKKQRDKHLYAQDKKLRHRDGVIV